MLFSKWMQQAKEGFVLSKYHKSAPQLSVALREEGEKKVKPRYCHCLEDRQPLYGVPLPADPNSVVCGCEVHPEAVDPGGALNLKILNFIMAGSLPVFLFGYCWFTEAKHTGSGLLASS